MTDKAIASDRTRFLLSLRAVRQFRGDPVPQEVVDDVLEVARLSGSASNKQPWELVVVRDQRTLQALAGVAARPASRSPRSSTRSGMGNPDHGAAGGRFDQEVLDALDRTDEVHIGTR